ncbi:hypothetical protein SBA3_1940036 [Candidatus Sulfopaludibacter sp. SbA3]|nr:hypothetical protein SBA3_1940036 [Candidatus Sulfopaludibacter sp. SbA3]
MARADNGILLAGNSVCTQQVQSTGLYFSGGTTVAKTTWTAFASITSNGPATEIFKAVIQNADGMTVNPPTPGTYFFHVCINNINNTSSKTVSYTLWAAGKGGSVTPLAGPTAATLGPQGKACAQFAIGLADRIGQSNVRVLWYMQEYDPDGNALGAGNSITTANFNHVVQPGSGAYMIELCATNTSQSTAAVSFQLISR